MKRRILKRRLNLFAVVELILLVISVAVVVQDVYLMTIYSYVNQVTVGWTWFGLGTFLLAFGVAGYTFDDLSRRANKKERI